MFKFLSGAALGLTAGTAIGAYVVVSKAVRSDLFAPLVHDMISAGTYRFFFGEPRPVSSYDSDYRPYTHYTPQRPSPGRRRGGKDYSRRSGIRNI